MARKYLSTGLGKHAHLRKSGQAINVLIADESRMGCQLMAAAFGRSPYAMEVKALAVESSEVRSAVKEFHPDVAVISASLKDGPTAGIRTARELRISGSKTKFIVLIDASVRAVVIEAFRAGAQGVVCREDPFETLFRSIYVVHQGQVWINTNQQMFLIDYLLQTAPPSRTRVGGGSLLTKREEGVVHLVSQGLTNREISHQLNLSEHTVRNYLFRIFNKLGTSTRVELALYATDLRQLRGIGDERSEMTVSPLPQ